MPNKVSEGIKKSLVLIVPVKTSSDIEITTAILSFLFILLTPLVLFILPYFIGVLKVFYF